MSEPGRWVSDREMDAYFALHEGEMQRLEQKLAGAPYQEVYFAAALTEIIAVLGPKSCDCNAHDCGLAEEVQEALTVARLALAGELRGVLSEQWTYTGVAGDFDEHRTPSPHDIDVTFDTRAEVETDAEKWAYEQNDARYMVLRRYVTDWEVMP